MGNLSLPRDLFPKPAANREPQCILLSLPTELLVHIISLLAARDKVKLRNLSWRLRSVCDETPSLWREFVWPYYHIGDEGCVKNVLKVCGQHVKHLCFPNHVTPSSKLVGAVLNNCINVTEISLPKVNVDSWQQLGRTLQHLEQLQRLNVLCDHDNTKELLRAINTAAGNIRELTVRVERRIVPDTLKDSWLGFWVLEGFVPANLNIITSHPMMLADNLWDCWILLKSRSPVGRTGHVKVYGHLRASLNLYPVLPEFQLEFGQEAVAPFVSTKSVRLGVGGNLLLLTDHANAVRKVSKAYAFLILYNVQLNHTLSNIQSVTEFIVPYSRIRAEHLEEIAITCPNLQRLNIKGNDFCLASLQGLHAISCSCLNLQGLNLLSISIDKVEDRMQLWEILSDIKLTHLAVDVCVLFPSDQKSLPVVQEERLIRTFQKCTSLQALECGSCSKYKPKCEYGLCHFSSLVHCTFSFWPGQIDCLHDLLTNCKHLKYLNYTSNCVTVKLSELHMPNLQELHFELIKNDIGEDFLTAISAHGGLVHVMLCLQSVTSDGLTAFVNNSPNLKTLNIILSVGIFNKRWRKNVKISKFEAELRKTFPHRELLTSGSFMVKIQEDNFNEEHLDISTTNLLSLWIRT